MPVDATEQILNEAVSAREDAPVIYPQEQLNWNIDDVDRRSYMVDRRMSGCFWLGSRKAIDPEHPGKIYVDRQRGRGPHCSMKGFMGGQIVALFLRPWLREYDRTYTITYQDAVTLDGEAIPALYLPAQDSPAYDPPVRSTRNMTRSFCRLPVKELSC